MDFTAITAMRPTAINNPITVIHLITAIIHPTDIHLLSASASVMDLMAIIHITTTAGIDLITIITEEDTDGEAVITGADMAEAAGAVMVEAAGVVMAEADGASRLIVHTNRFSIKSL